MTKAVFAPGTAILRAKPLFELCDAGVEPKRVKKLPPKIGPSSASQRVVPFDSEMIFEAVVSSPGAHAGNSASLVGLTSLHLELANVEDLVTESTTPLTKVGYPEQGTGEQSPRSSENASSKSVDSLLSPASSQRLLLLAPLKVPPKTSQRAVRSQASRSAPRVAQRYQLRHPDELIAEASARRRIVDEILELENRRRRKEEELARIYKREKEAKAEQGLKVIRTQPALKTSRPRDLAYTELLE